MLLWQRPGKSHGQSSLIGYNPWVRKESDMTERLHFHCKCLDYFVPSLLKLPAPPCLFKLSTDDFYLPVHLKESKENFQTLTTTSGYLPVSVSICTVPSHVTEDELPCSSERPIFSAIPEVMLSQFKDVAPATLSLSSASWLCLPLTIHHSLQHTITLWLLPFRKPPLALPSCPATHWPLCPFLAKLLELDVYINHLQFFPLILSWTHFRHIFTPALCENCSFFNITNGIHISKPVVISQSSPSLTN